MGTHDNQNYEVQVYHRGRWQAHARYEFHERAVAIREGKELGAERKALPVRVIMEDYNPKTARHDEVLIYRNKIDTAKTASPANPRTSWADMSVTSDGRAGFLVEDYDDYDDYDDPFEKSKRAKAPVSVWMFLGICSMVLVICVSIGSLATGALALLFKGFDVVLADNVRRALLVGMFIIVSLIAAMSSIQHYTAQFDLNPFRRKKKEAIVYKQSAISKEMEKAAKAIDDVPILETEPEPESTINIFDNFEILEEEVEEFSSEAEQQKMFLINFLGTCLGALKRPEANVQTLNRFGINLFMTGAVVGIAQNHDLTDNETDIILQRILEMLGAKPDQISRFSLEYEKYLVEPRHTELFEGGARIAAQFSDGDQSAPLHIHEIIENWVNWIAPIDENINPNLLTIMFTDMVGSTDLTTKHGDYAAQEVLKTHDLIVRTALTNLDGIEIKHLGDGIMASFKDHSLALEAAIEIQKRVEGNNNTGPEFPLHLRIGINAGEPIKKDNDLFGTSVQLAARLCDKAITDGILISKEFRDLFDESSTYTFVDLGPQDLKGFPESLLVYQLDWQAPPLVAKEFEETESAEDQSTTHASLDETAAPDMAVLAPNKVINDPNFNAGYVLEKSVKIEPAAESKVPVELEEQVPSADQSTN